MTDAVYSLKPDKTFHDMARVYRNGAVVAAVYRSRKTKRSAWVVTISPVGGFSATIPLDEYAAHHAAIASVARQWQEAP